MTHVPSLFALASDYFIKNKPFVLLSPVPRTVQIDVNRAESRKLFDYRFRSLTTIPEECFVYNKSGWMKVGATLKRAEEVLCPKEMFELYCATGAIEECSRIWELCDQAAQNQLKSHRCLIISCFAHLSSRPRQRSYSTCTFLFRIAAEMHWDALAIGFFSKMEPIGKKYYLLSQWETTLKKEELFEKRVECDLLSQMIIMKDFCPLRETCESIDLEMDRERFAKLEEALFAPEKCSIYPITECLRTDGLKEMTREQRDVLWNYV
ncbi:hypothetical protein QR680_010864 [Steinernema hermaphroditum]|uniref:Uncharacterized protein n=1 Tax=Steinernema hermaphroditum TaxID=289476 RepID=A0AA39IRR6_9BILA|nr:hypothetical protein QR680_010864 [Steinernema hermaphroditum]